MMQNLIYCIICEKLLEDCVYKNVCLSCFNFTCTTCLNSLTKLDCPCCRTPFLHIKNAQTVNIESNNQTEVDTNNNLLIENNISPETPINSTDENSSTDSRISSNFENIFVNHFSGQRIDNGNVQRSNSLIESEILFFCIPYSISRNRYLVNNNTDNRHYSERVKWSDMLSNKYGLRKFFWKRSEELNNENKEKWGKNLAPNTLVSMLKKEFESTPEWSDYERWVRNIRLRS